MLAIHVALIKFIFFRFLLNLLAAFSLIHPILMQITPHEIHCNFQYRFDRYTCLLDDVSISTETVPLTFFNVHLPDHNDNSVTALDTASLCMLIEKYAA